MATQDDVRRVALSLPETTEDDDRFSFSVRNGAKQKKIVWVWLERIHPKKARVPNPDFVVVQTADLGDKEAILATDPSEETFVRDPHYKNYAGLVVRLAAVDADELAELITDSWRAQAPAVLVQEFDA